MIHLYYYNPKVIEHLYLQFTKLPVNMEEISKVNSTKVSMGAKILKLINGNAENAFDISKMKHIEYSEDYKVLKTIEEMQSKCMDIDAIIETENLSNHMWRYVGECKVSQIVLDTEKERLIKIVFYNENTKYEGTTSYENWISSSMLNHVLCNKKMYCEIAFMIINNKKRTREMQVLWIINQTK